MKVVNLNIDPKWKLLLFFLLALWVLYTCSSCSPVKRVLLNDKYYKQVTDKFVLDGGCVNDTIFASDTTVLFDTLYSLDYKTDTVTIDNIKSIVKTEYKTVTKTVIIRDTAVVTDQTQINLLKSQIASKDVKLKSKEDELSQVIGQLKEWKFKARKKNFMFWGLVFSILVFIFKKPIFGMLRKSILKI